MKYIIFFRKTGVSIVEIIVVCPHPFLFYLRDDDYRKRYTDNSSPVDLLTLTAPKSMTLN